jgi:hypothetical protein
MRQCGFQTTLLPFFDARVHSISLTSLKFSFLSSKVKIKNNSQALFYED